MSRRRLSFTERRRHDLARRVDRLEALESRSMITESLGMMLGVGVPLAAPLVARHAEHARGVAQTVRPHAHTGMTDHAVLPFTAAKRPQPASHANRPEHAPARPTAHGNDWLTLTPPRTNLAPAATPIRAPRPSTAGGAATAPRGGGAGSNPGQITPLRLPAPQDSTNSTTGALGASVGAPARSAAMTIPPPPSRSAPLTASASAAVVPPGSGGGTTVSGGAPQQTGSGGQAESSPTSAPYLTAGNSSGPSQGQFSHFELYTLDYNDGQVLFPGVTQLATIGGNVDLRAQVRDTTVSSYSWDTTGLTDAVNITGTNTYRLQFAWGNNNTGVLSNSVTLTVTNSSNQTEVQTYDFTVPRGTHQGPGTGTATWPTTLSPDTVLASAPSFDSHNVSVDATSGALDTSIALPAYNPNVPALALTYDSLTADPRPIIVAPHTLDDSQAVPSKVSAQLTFNGTSDTTYYYDTSHLIPGDIQQIGMQADATSLSTGRYSYTATIADIRSTNTTFTYTGSATVINNASSAFGDGWTLSGLEKITSATGGVFLDLGSGGKSLWFSGGGPYTSPAGDFSTLAAVSGGGYTRTLTDGTVYNFDSNGRETSVADRNGLRVTFAYSGGNLQTITDPYNNVTTFTYSGGLLSTITDPANRVTTLTHTGNNLTGVTLPDNGAWSYGYESAGRMTQVADPNAHTTSVAYDSSERVSTITQPDLTTETFLPNQERGWTNSGTSSSPASPTLLAEASSTFTDPLSHTSSIRPDWNGQGQSDVQTDPDGNVTVNDRDGNGLATIMVDRLNRTSQASFDTSGNLKQWTFPDLNTQSYGTYNSFAEPSSFTNENNETTNYTYDSHGNETVIQDALLNLTTMTYTGNGKLATVEDARLNTTTYQYDSQDRLTTIVYPDTATKLYAYDNKGNATTYTDERGDVTVTSFDAMNRVTGVTDALLNHTTYVYDSGGRQIAVQEPLSRTTSYAFDAMDRVVTVTDPLNHSTVFGHDSGGNLHTVTDAISRVTTFSYDAENRRTVVQDPLGDRTTTTYDAEGQVINVLDPMSRLTTITYSVRGWKATETDPLGNITTYTYTNTGQQGSVTQFVGVGSITLASYAYDNDDRLIAYQDGLNHITTYGYDAVGNRVTVEDANSNTTTYAYDSRNRLTTITDPLLHSVVYGHDSGGNQVTVKDAVNDVTTTAYDALNRATTVTDAMTGQTLYSFDAAGRQTVVVDPNGNRTTFGFDAADRLTTLTTPIGTATYVYDNGNEKTDQTDADGRRTTFAFDSGGRMTNERWLDSSGRTVNTLTYTYDADGEMTGAADQNAALTFTYDSGGNQLTAQTSSTGGQPNVTLTSGFDQAHNRTTLADNLSSAGLTTFSFDSALRLTTIAESIGGTSGPQVVLGYDPANRLTSESRTIGGSGTAVNTTLAYDNANRLTTLTHQVTGGTALATYLYGYDNANRVTSEHNAEGTVSYTYNADNELTGASGSRSESYSFDSGGNRTMTGYSTGSDNEMTAGAGYTYTYDAEGNTTGMTQTSGGTLSVTFSYDYRNRLTGVTERSSPGGTITLQATYTYDALNRRIGVDNNGTQTWAVWDGQNPYAQFNGSGAVQDRYLHGPAIDELFARTDSGGTSAWYLTDRLGSVRDIVNTSGTVLDHVVYDSYGNVTSETHSPSGDQFKFAGMQYDGLTGWYFDNARYFDPGGGRFVNQDPSGLATDDANLYRYAGNDPTNRIDPTGLDGQEPPQSLPPIPTKTLPQPTGPVTRDPDVVPAGHHPEHSHEPMQNERPKRELDAIPEMKIGEGTGNQPQVMEATGPPPNVGPRPDRRPRRTFFGYLLNRRARRRRMQEAPVIYPYPQYYYPAPVQTYPN